jgi:hypothetical protein
MQVVQQWVACQVTAYTQFGHFPFFFPPPEVVDVAFAPRSSRASCASRRAHSFFHWIIFVSDGGRQMVFQLRCRAFLLLASRLSRPVILFRFVMCWYRSHSSSVVYEQPGQRNFVSSSYSFARICARDRVVVHDPLQISACFRCSSSEFSTLSHTDIDSPSQPDISGLLLLRLLLFPAAAAAASRVPCLLRLLAIPLLLLVSSSELLSPTPSDLGESRRLLRFH